MKKIIVFSVLISMGLFAVSQSLKINKIALPKTLTISKKKLLDKIKGGWAGQTIGCAYGGPAEFMHNGTMVQDYTPIEWNDDRIKWYYDNFPGLYDDLYMDMTFVSVFEKLGLDAPIDSFAKAFAHSGYPLWHANQAARYNILQGINPSLSGNWLNNPHADDIDYQIESDYAGLMSPGMPNQASAFSNKIGHMITYGNGWYGGVYVGAMYATAFVTDNIETVVSQGLKTIPEKSRFHQCIADVIKWHKQFPNDWKATWFECQKKWSQDIGCPDGVFVPLDIDALLNSAYVTIGLLYGQGDYSKTIDVATRCGEDADCNSSTAGGILGAMLGYSKIPEYWKRGLSKVEDRNFAYTDLSLNKVYSIGFKHALAVIKRNGGTIDDDKVVIACQQPVAVPFEESFSGHFPVKKIPVSKSLSQNPEIIFEGIGIVVKGYVQSHENTYVAKAAMYIDGILIETVNLPVEENAHRVDLFWKYQLPKGTHKVSFKWLNPLKDASVNLGEALIYSDTPNKIIYP